MKYGQFLTHHELLGGPATRALWQKAERLPYHRASRLVLLWKAKRRGIKMPELVRMFAEQQALKVLKASGAL